MRSKASETRAGRFALVACLDLPCNRFGIFGREMIEDRLLPFRVECLVEPDNNRQWHRCRCDFHLPSGFIAVAWRTEKISVARFSGITAIVACTGRAIFTLSLRVHISEPTAAAAVSIAEGVSIGDVHSGPPC